MITKPQITFDEFLEIQAKLDIRIGRITAAESVPKSYGIKLTVDFGNGVVKTAFTNLGKKYHPEVFVARIVPFVVNLTPVEIKGVTSEVMIMVGESIDNNDEFEKYTIGTKLL